MKVITVHRLSLQFDADQTTHGSDEQQVRHAIERINATLQKETGFGVQLFDHRDEIEIESGVIEGDD